jgi:hypothetical protein
MGRRGAERNAEHPICCARNHISITMRLDDSRRRAMKLSRRVAAAMQTIMRIKCFKSALIQGLVVTLLVFLAGFSTLAKNVQYLPKSNPARYLSIASKMKANSGCPSVSVKPQPAQPSSRLLIPEPVLFVSNFDQREAPPVQRISLIVCLRHRAPPTKPS